ncbi:MAG: hypothetical protein A2583_02050 [Bdellovibrionales bacterium RIFOXYD1_FULL_53_11]|nr:MAG: hypothetical protein A2583_02050 [Bdellovibrionales bacterium RIFOXYD1_FULL_53_11]
MNKKLAARSAAIMLVAVVLGACTKTGNAPDDPKKRLSEYISKSFSVTTIDDRQKMLSYLSRDAKNRLAAWSDEQFKQAFMDSKRQFIKLIIRETKQVSPAEMNITYEISFLDQTRGKDARVTNKKLCTMILDGGRWLITEVRNIKELVEYRNEMALP